MKKIDFTKLGGLPLKQGTLDFMQGAHLELLKAFADWASRTGRLRENSGSGGVILTGIEKTTEGGIEKYTPGWILRDGELLRFGGANVTDVDDALGIGIQTVTTNSTFKDGTVQGVYEQKIAVPGGENPLHIEMYFRMVNLGDLRPVLARTLSAHVPAVPPGTLVNVSFVVPGATQGDVAMVSIEDALDGGLTTTYGISEWASAQARVPADGQVQVTLLNHHKTVPAFDGKVNFKIRILK